MKLILWRHAKAVDGSPDRGRELTAKGKKQAETMATWLKRCPPQSRHDHMDCHVQLIPIEL